MFKLTSVWDSILARSRAKLSNLLSVMDNTENSLRLNKTGEIYHDIVYTVVPKDMALDQGIFPEDQKFSTKYVFLWDNWRDLSTFPEKKWKKVLIHLPQNIKFTELTRIPGNGYGIKYVPNAWKIKEQNFLPRYS